MKDSTGKDFGAELIAGMQKPEGQMTEVSYLFPRPGPDTTPVQKVSLVTRVSDDLVDRIKRFEPSASRKTP